MTISRAKTRTFLVLAHAGFWIMFGCLVILISHYISKDWLISFNIAFVDLVVMMPMVYFLLFYCIPRYWDQGKFGSFFSLLFISLLVSAFIRHFGTALIVDLSGKSPEMFDRKEFFFQLFIGGAFIFVLSIPLRFFDIYLKKNRIEEHLNTFKIDAELRFLKAQVNPHFLFNALNNIYSLAYNKSEKTPDMILKLSDMMSFMLYDCKGDKVPLSSEIKYLHDYLELYQLKKSGEQNISLEVKGDAKNINIPPMLFVPFFENAFKHGNVTNTRDGYLKSQFKIEGNYILFFIENTKSHSPNQNGIENENGGIGLENVRQRLELLFPNTHKLTITNEKNFFRINLSINNIQP